MLHTQFRVQRDCLGDQIGGKLEEVLFEKLREVLGEFLRLFQTALQSLRQLSNLRHVGVVLNHGVRDVLIELHLLGHEELDEEVEKLCVLLLIEIIISEHLVGPDDGDLAPGLEDAGYGAVDGVRQRS